MLQYLVSKVYKQNVKNTPSVYVIFDFIDHLLIIFEGREHKYSS